MMQDAKKSFLITKKFVKDCYKKKLRILESMNLRNYESMNLRIGR